MSLTKATHKRFWQTMGERFGKRWLDEYGAEPTRAWIDMLDRYAPDDIRSALIAMPSKGWIHPPTQPQFEALLVDAAKKRGVDDTDYVRGYWQSAIMNQVSRDFWLAKIIPSMFDFEQHLIQHSNTLGVQLRELLNHVNALEKRTGQRTDGMHEHVRKVSFALALEKSPYWRQLSPARRARSDVA